jgi:hypothetical protein
LLSPSDDTSTHELLLAGANSNSVVQQGQQTFAQHMIVVEDLHCLTYNQGKIAKLNQRFRGDVGSLKREKRRNKVMWWDSFLRHNFKTFFGSLV